MDVLEAMRLFGECGFDFLPETDLQKRPGLEVVMTVGLHLCALEMTDQQLDTLACIALAGQLLEFFPLKQWISAVKKSFLSQERKGPSKERVRTWPPTPDHSKMMLLADHQPLTTARWCY